MIDNTQLVNNMETTEFVEQMNLDQTIDVNATNIADMHQQSMLDFEKKMRSKIDQINDYTPMNQPWRGHVDNFARSLVKTKKRKQKELPNHNTSVSESLNKTKEKNMSTTSMRTNKSNKEINKTANNISKIKEEANIKITSVEPHNKYNDDLELEKLRRDKEAERKQKLEQMKKLREIQAEEENQRKQVQKLQAEMKTKPFV